MPIINGLDEIYATMMELRNQYYASLDDTLKIDIALFFRLFKLVCDMRTIQRIVDNE